MKRSIFDAVALLDHQDERAAKNQRRGSERERQRSLAAQSQTEIYSRLVETRILLQRSLVHGAAAAAVGVRKNANSEDENGEKEEETSGKEEHVNLSETIVQCNDLLAKLLRARQTLFPQTPDGNGESDYEQLLHNHNRDQLDSELQLSKTLQTEFERYQTEWKEVLDRRHKDVRLHSGATHKTQFRVMDASFWQQVENTVQHEELRHHQHIATDSESSSVPAIFDDSKVYQQLLKDFVAVRGAATHNGNNNNGTFYSGADPIQQRKQSKAAKNKKAPVDRRASKGRKIRYTEIQKLTNFTFPKHRSSSGVSSGNDLDEDAWFKSLFGGAVRSKF